MRLLKAILISFLLSVFVYAEQTKLLVMTEDYRPFQFKNEKGELSGFAVELMREVFKEAKLGFEKDKIVMQAWPRSYATLQKSPMSALFMTTRNEKREKMFKWVGPIAPRAMWFYCLKSRKDITVKSFSDLKVYKVGSVRGSASTNQMLKEGLKVDLSLDDDKNMQKFIKGRVDLVAALELSMSHKLKHYGLTYQDVNKLILLNDDYSYYLALNLAVSDSIVEKLQEALDKLKENGRFDKLYQSYLEAK